jgi:hypothetical protein
MPINRMVPRSENEVAAESVIRIMCPNIACKRVLAVPTHARGKLVRCKSCGINIRIPQEKKEEVAPVAPDAANQAKPAAGKVEKAA